jgi:hypothetical protein
MSKRNHREKNKIQNIFALCLIMCVIAIFLGSTIIYIQKINESKLIDPINWCPKSGPKSNFIVLIDNSDVLNEVQKLFIKIKIKKWSEEIEKHGGFQLYEIDDRTTLYKPTISVCNPGTKESVSQYTANKARADKKYNDIFREPVDTLLDKINKNRVLSTSPIMETIQAISVNNMQYINKKGTLKIIIISDFIQNTNGFSMYSNLPDFEEFSLSRHSKSIKSELNNVEVELLVLNRESLPPQVNQDKIIKFWKKWIEFQGANVTQIINVPG